MQEWLLSLHFLQNLGIIIIKEYVYNLSLSIYIILGGYGHGNFKY
jgi:hypothetical protein